jgi:hypothetical protein
MKTDYCDTSSFLRKWTAHAKPVLGPNAWGKTPAIIDAMEILLQHDTSGDPIHGLTRTRKTTEKIAEVPQQIATNSSLPRSKVPAYLLAADPLPATPPSPPQRRQ